MRQATMAPSQATREPVPSKVPRRVRAVPRAGGQARAPGISSDNAAASAAEAPLRSARARSVGVIRRWRRSQAPGTPLSQAKAR